MKKHLLSLLAIILAIGLNAFTTKHTTKKFTDVTVGILADQGGSWLVERFDAIHKECDFDFVKSCTFDYSIDGEDAITIPSSGSVSISKTDANIRAGSLCVGVYHNQ